MAAGGKMDAMFFVIFTMFGSFGLGFLILATLVSKFDCGDKEDFTFSKVMPINEAYEWFKKFLRSLKDGGERKVLRRKRQEEARFGIKVERENEDDEEKEKQ